MNVLMTEDLLDLYSNGYSNHYKEIAKNPVLLKGFIRIVETMKAVERVEDLKKFSWMHYERLKYDYSGYSSVRLSNAYIHRLIFEEQEGGVEAHLIEIDDTHYGNK